MCYPRFERRGERIRGMMKRARRGGATQRARADVWSDARFVGLRQCTVGAWVEHVPSQNKLMQKYIDTSHKIWYNYRNN